jgi:hypothetical protein
MPAFGGKNDLVEALVVVQGAVCNQFAGYTHLEEERMITAIIATLKRQLVSNEEITQWIQGFVDFTLTVNSMPEKLIIRANVKNFLQSLYFRLQWAQKTDKYDTAINQALRNINLFTHYESD